MGWCLDRRYPVSALAQARLASVAFLFENGDPPRTYAERALALTGVDEEIVDYIAEIALRIDEPALAVRCWHRSLILRPEVWPLVADSVDGRLAPDRILKEVLAGDAAHTVAFAEQVYDTPEEAPLRERFLRTALDRLDRDASLSEAERLWLEAQARSGLGEMVPARRAMEAALAREPRRSEWRALLVERLLAWGDYEEAHRQALVGSNLDPDDPELQKLLERTVDALARGGGEPEDQQGHP